MVSLADRQYLKQQSSNSYTRSLIEFLYEKKLSDSSASNGTTADDITISALRAVQRNDTGYFDRSYDEIKRRKPGPDSDWIYNDFLLFALTVGVAKFNRGSEWLLDVLRIRMENLDGEKRLITQTLLDAVKGNFENTNNHKPLMIVIKHFLSLSLGSEEYVDSTYREVVEVTFPRYESIFLNIVCLRVVDLIVFHKRLGSMEWYRTTEHFLEFFRKRVRQLAWVVWIFILMLVAGATIYFWYYFLTSRSDARDSIGIFLQLLPSLGISSLLAPVLKWRKQIIGLFERVLLWFFGYRIPERNQLEQE